MAMTEARAQVQRRDLDMTASLPEATLSARERKGKPKLASAAGTPRGITLVGGMGLLVRSLARQVLGEPLEPLRERPVAVLLPDRLHPDFELSPHDHREAARELAHHRERRHVAEHE